MRGQRFAALAADPRGRATIVSGAAADGETGADRQPPSQMPREHAESPDLNLGHNDSPKDPARAERRFPRVA
jgi:hypothetical protein